MIDFSEISTEQILARGQYSMARASREAWMKTLRELCEQQNSAAVAVLRDLQANQDVQRHFAFMHDTLAQMAEAVTEIDELTKQLDLIRPLAFPK